jgi:hypothetical protein
MTDQNLRLAAEAYAQGNTDLGDFLIDTSVEAERNRQWDEYCCQLDFLEYKQWLKKPFNKLKLKRLYEKSTKSMSFELFCEFEYGSTDYVY